MKTQETKYQTIHIEPLDVNGMKYILFKTEEDTEVKTHLRNLEGIILDQTLDAFIIEDGKGVISRIFNHVRIKNWFLDYSKLRTPDSPVSTQITKSVPFIKTKFILPETLEIQLKKFKSWMQQRRYAKGGKDRVLPLPEKLLELFIRYYKVYKPVTWLIEGQDKNTPYSEGSLQNIFKKYFSGIDKLRNFTLHCLRHSYATHLLESGTDIRYIQELLGHKSSRTTEIYTYVSMRSLQHIKNPIDDFDL